MRPQTAGGSATEAAIAAPADASPSLNASPAVAGVVPPQPAAAQADTARTARLSEIEQFRAYFQDDPGLSRFTAALKRALAEVESHGLLDSLEHPMTEGNHTRVRVYPVGNPEFLRSYDVDQVRIGQVLPQLRQYLHRELGSPVVAERIFYWLQGNLPTTLSYDSNLTHQLGEQEVRNIPPVTIRYMAGQTVLAPAGERISAATLAVLQDEHREFVNQLGPAKLIAFSLSKFGMYIAMYLLCGFYILFRQPALLDSTAKIGKMLGLAVLAVAVSWFAAESWFELIPMLMFAMTVSIVYQQELALLLTVAVALVAVLSLGLGVVELVTILSATASAILLLRHVRTRTKLIWVALWSAFVTMATAIGVGTLSVSEPASVLLVNAAWLGGCAVASGLLMTGLLPFVERFYGVQTDLSLLELGDVAHPLLQELVRRAPGTYNHSINVASIGQAPAEAVGANGLFVRVGAYFHDIGKMLKPGYFVENQSGEGNCHESLVPAMSTLVIIAHVKDGAGLAREHNLPQPLIDFIEQHHGTTLVEYFYRRANEQQKEADGRSEVDEGTYRYPGPKPQTREAAVLMLADGVESAARTLVDPAPSRIENLVEKIAMNKLMDGQFDECGLTLKELRMIQDSLVKSLTAVYHGRIKYPDQQTA